MKDARGFTLIEVIVVVAILGILLAFSVPSMIDWTRNASYREAARNLLLKSREAHTLAIERNLEHRVEIDVDGRRIRLTRGDRSTNSTEYTPVYDWETLSPNVLLRSRKDCALTTDINFHFNTNGSSSNNYICVLTADNAPRFRVGITSTSTGRSIIDTCDPTVAPKCLND